MSSNRPSCRNIRARASHDRRAWELSTIVMFGTQSQPDQSFLSIAEYLATNPRAAFCEGNTFHRTGILPENSLRNDVFGLLKIHAGDQSVHNIGTDEPTMAVLQEISRYTTADPCQHISPYFEVVGAMRYPCGISSTQFHVSAARLWDRVTSIQQDTTPSFLPCGKVAESRRGRWNSAFMSPPNMRYRDPRHDPRLSTRAPSRSRIRFVATFKRENEDHRTSEIDGQRIALANVLAPARRRVRALRETA
jgi:hypothetical protein